MKSELHLRVGAERLCASWKPHRSGRFSVSALLRTKTDAASKPVEGAAGISNDEVGEALESLWASLTADGARPSGCTLRVQVGFKYSLVGVVRLAANQLGRTTGNAMLEVVAQTWMRETYGIDVNEHVIRWQLSSDEERLVISCVHRNVFRALEKWAAAHYLSFETCKPAVLDAIAAAAKTNASKRQAILACREVAPSPESPVVQLFHLERGSPRSTWRVAAGLPTGSDASDSQLTAFVRRYIAACGISEPADTLACNWAKDESLVKVSA